MSSLEYKALCIDINFLIIYFFCLSSFVYFKNGPEYLTKGITEVVIILANFLQ